MQAVVCHNFGPLESLRIEALPQPVPGAGEVLVEVHAAGLNFHDVLAVEGRSQLQRKLPITPGIEAAGIVAGLGPGVTRFKLGERVFGKKTHGTFAEQVVFAEDELATIPDHMDMTVAATFFNIGSTVLYALRDRARLSEGEILLVLGAGGGGGLAAVEIGKALGAKVVAAASSQEKLALATAAGADAAVCYPEGPLDLAAQKAFCHTLLEHAVREGGSQNDIGKINSVTQDAGYHVILDGVGGTYMEPAMRALGWEGRYLAYGFAAGMPKIAPGPLLFKNADMLGIQPTDERFRLPGRNTEMLETLFAWYGEGKLQPQVKHYFPLAEAVAALNLLKNRKATGRVVLTMPAYHAG